MYKDFKISLVIYMHDNKMKETIRRKTLTSLGWLAD